ncbi:MAG: diacylglycerol kinase family lipid kinase [Spirochaetes bacterium]|nr:diacylglycerol kinase family lipid kinase [Spirochaetota bacterium]
MEKRCALIFNPVAGKGKARTLRPLIEAWLAGADFAIDIMETESHGHAGKLAYEACGKGYSMVVAAGGDGTCNEVINGMMEFRRKQPEKLPALGILPIGRGNDFAYGVGIPAKLEAACKSLLAGNEEDLDIGSIKGGFYPDGRFFGNGIGIGFDTIVGLKAAEKKNVQGAITYLYGAIDTLISYPKAPHISIHFNNESRELQTHQISILNGRRMGGMFHMAPFGKKNDGLLDLCLVNKSLTRREMLRLMLHYIKGSQHRSGLVENARAPDFHILAPNGGLVCHADGETICIDGTELTVECIPAALRIICDPDLPADLPIVADGDPASAPGDQVADIA